MQADRQWMTSVAVIWHSMTVSSYDMHVKPSESEDGCYSYHNFSAVLKMIANGHSVITAGF